MDAPGKEIISRLNNEWHQLKHGNPIPSLYPQSGVETVMVRGTSEIHDDVVVTNYEIVVTDEGKVVGTYTVQAREDVGRITSL